MLRGDVFIFQHETALDPLTEAKFPHTTCCSINLIDPAKFNKYTYKTWETPTPATKLCNSVICLVTLGANEYMLLW